jgi:serine phosphatase RsbU (regulator of sigma subunit)
VVSGTAIAPPKTASTLRAASLPHFIQTRLGERVYSGASAVEDVVALSIGDVYGLGAEKFAAMGEVRQTVRDAVGRGLDPLQTLAVASRFLRRYDPEENATAILALLNLRQRSLIFANAGHARRSWQGRLAPCFLSTRRPICRSMFWRKSLPRCTR